jgi:hypothetical protein
MLAWAVTIHKGQGKTFDKVIIDVGSGTFAHGQMYVALSRCTTLEGIVLKKPALKKHIWTNYQVMDFLTKYQYGFASAFRPSRPLLLRRPPRPFQLPLPAPARLASLRLPASRPN